MTRIWRGKTRSMRREWGRGVIIVVHLLLVTMLLMVTWPLHLVWKRRGGGEFRILTWMMSAIVIHHLLYVFIDNSLLLVATLLAVTQPWLFVWRKEGEESDYSPWFMWLVTMTCIITIWMMCMSIDVPGHLDAIEMVCADGLVMCAVATLLLLLLLRCAVIAGDGWMMAMWGGSCW